MTAHRRTNRARRTAAAALACGIALAAAGPVSLVLPPAATAAVAGGARAPVATAGEESGGRLELLLDSSGSMAEPADGGVRKIDAARSALHRVVRGVPAGVQVGMRVYGARGRAGGNACTDSQAVVPIGSADAAQRGRLDAAIDRYSPKGETPISHGLEQAANDLGPTGRRTILLVSDGEETCNADPCATARSLAARGVDLKIDVVGLKVDAATKRQLECVADAGNGTYYDAASAEQLASSLQVSAVRAFRPFRLTGTPVQGALGNAAMPVLGAGQYLDTMPATVQPLRYRIRKPAGGTVWISTTLFLSGIDDAGLDGQSMELTDAAGKKCASDVGAGVARGGIAASSVAELASGPDVYAQLNEESCSAATELVLSVHRGTSDTGSLGGDDPAPFELVIAEEPPVVPDASLPLPARQPQEVSLPTAGAPVPVVGGASFSDAPLVPATGGTDAIRPGEALVYKVPVRYGQQPVFRFDIGAADPATKKRILSDYGRNVIVQLRNPLRSEISTAVATYRGGAYRESASLLYRGDPMTSSVTGPQVRHLNRTSGGAESAAREGFYYLFVTLSASSGDTTGFSVPITIRGAAVGTPSGAPALATGPVYTATPTPSPTGPTVTAPASTAPAEVPTDPTSAPATVAATGDPGTVAEAGDAGSADAATANPARTVAISVAAIAVVAALVLLALALLRRPSQEQ